MIIPSRSYERRQPFRDARKIFIVCEGRRREYHYFRYFQEIDSRVDLKIHELHPHEDNSPSGLLQIACDLAVADFDEVWIVFDRDPDKLDSRNVQIAEIRKKCESEASWNAVMSNPCFEVWLFYHFFTSVPDFEGLEISSNWKKHLNEVSGGGFDSRKHPLLIEAALLNSQTCFIYSAINT